MRLLSAHVLMKAFRQILPIELGKAIFFSKLMHLIERDQELQIQEIIRKHPLCANHRDPKNHFKYLQNNHGMFAVLTLIQP